MNYKDTVVIVYPVGGYGTFIEWCLMYFSGLLPDHSLPFTDAGSSHLYSGHFLDAGIESKKFPKFKSIPAEEYLSGDDVYPYVRTHGSLRELTTNPNYTAKSYINKLYQYVSKFVLVNVPLQARLMVLGNEITKPKVALSVQGTFYENVISEFKDQFGVEDSSNVPKWQLREMISYWQERRLSIPVDVYTPIDDPKVVNVCVRDLVDNFESTLHQLAVKLDIQLKHTDRIQDIKQKWLSLQRFTNSDQISNQIIDSVVNNKEHRWGELNLIEEAFVQWQLRDFHKLDLLCYGLDQFPTTSSDLRQVLVPIA